MRSIRLELHEEDTIKRCMDYALQRIDGRLAYSGPEEIDKFALNLSRHRIGVLRRRLWADTPKQEQK